MSEVKDKFVKYGLLHELVKVDVVPFDRGVLKRRSVGVAMYVLKLGSRIVGFNVERLRWDVTPFGDGSFKICMNGMANWGSSAWSYYSRERAEVRYGDVLEKLLNNDEFEDEQTDVD